MSGTLRRLRGPKYGKIYPESKGQFRRIWWEEEPKITHTKYLRYQKYEVHKLDEYSRLELDKLLSEHKGALKAWYHSGTLYAPRDKGPKPLVLKSYNKYDLGVPMVCHVEWHSSLYSTGLNGFVKAYEYDITSFLYIVNVYEEYKVTQYKRRKYSWRSWKMLDKFHNQEEKLKYDLSYRDTLDDWEEYNEKAYPILVDCGLIKEDDDFDIAPYDYFASLDYFHDLMDFAGDDEELKFKLRWKWLRVTQERWDQERNF